MNEKKERILASYNRLLSSKKITQEQYNEAISRLENYETITEAIKDQAIQEVQNELNKETDGTV